MQKPVQKSCDLRRRLGVGRIADEQPDSKIRTFRGGLVPEGCSRSVFMVQMFRWFFLQRPSSCCPLTLTRLLISLNLADFSMQFGVRSVGASPGCSDASAVGQNIDYRPTCVLLVK